MDEKNEWVTTLTGEHPENCPCSWTYNPGQAQYFNPGHTWIIKRIHGNCPEHRAETYEYQPLNAGRTIAGENLKDEITALYRTGTWTYREIADELGITYTKVYQTINPPKPRTAYK